MVTALTASRTAPSADAVARLRERIERIERTTRIGSEAPTFPAPPPLARLLPGGGLRTGVAYALGPSMPLLLSMLAPPSAAGAWCAVVGMPELGVEAAADAGIDLDRLVLIPRPGARWLGVVAAVAEVVGLVALRPGGRIGDGEAARLAARLRERETVLLAQGAWPGAEATIAADRAEWSGLGDGFGYLEGGEAVVTVESRRTSGARGMRFALAGARPEASGPSRSATTADAGDLVPAAPRRLQAVG